MLKGKQEGIHLRNRPKEFICQNNFRDYKILGKKGEGTFSEVVKCQHVKTGKFYACKIMRQHYDNLDQVSSVREIQAMKKLSQHPNIIALFDVIFDKRSGQLALVLELMDMNAYEMIRGRKQYLPESKVKHYIWQLCSALDHVHRNGIFHRDVKPENILIKEDLLKLADFGSCRHINSSQPFTEYISTRWYRAPECLLTDGYYSHEMDIWSVGCVMFEILSLRPLFPGANEVDQISKIHDILGTPSQDIINRFKNKSRSVSFKFTPKRGMGIGRLLHHISQEGVDLICKLCEYDPDKRISAPGALKHAYFAEYRHRVAKPVLRVQGNQDRVDWSLQQASESQLHRSPRPMDIENQAPSQAGSLKSLLENEENRSSKSFPTDNNTKIALKKRGKIPSLHGDLPSIHKSNQMHKNFLPDFKTGGSTKVFQQHPLSLQNIHSTSGALNNKYQTPQLWKGLLESSQINLMKPNHEPVESLLNSSNHQIIMNMRRRQVDPTASKQASFLKSQHQLGPNLMKFHLPSVYPSQVKPSPSDNKIAHQQKNAHTAAVPPK